MIHLATTAGSRPQGGDDDEVEFCSYCGRLGADQRRVCTDCGLGVRLRTGAAALRTPGAPFLIVRADGRVSAASAAAERFLAGSGSLIGKPVLCLLATVDGEDLQRLVALAATSGGEPTSCRVELVGAARRRGEMYATVAACGDPRAALVVLEQLVQAA